MLNARHMAKLTDEEPELSLLPSLSQQVHKSFKDAVIKLCGTI